MHFLQDVFVILSDLPLHFQRDTCSIPDALESVETACLRLVALQQRPGEHLQGFLDALQIDHQELKYQGIKLSPKQLTDGQMKEKRNALVDAVIDRIDHRLQDLSKRQFLTPCRCSSQPICLMVQLNWQPMGKT